MFIRWIFRFQYGLNTYTCDKEGPTSHCLLRTCILLYKCMYNTDIFMYNRVRDICHCFEHITYPFDLHVCVALYQVKNIENYTFVGHVIISEKIAF